MMDRTLFPGMQLFKKTVTENFLVTLREIFKAHPAYPYLANAADSKIVIEPTYGTVTHEGRVPQMLVKTGPYRFSLNDTIDKNMVSEMRNELGVIGGFRSQKDMFTTVKVFVRSYIEEESSNLADEVVMLGAYAADYMFNQMGIQIQDSNVSETIERDASKDVYETQVDFSVLVPWELTKVSKEAALDPGIDIELPDGFDPDAYRAPGSYVIQAKWKKDK